MKLDSRAANSFHRQGPWQAWPRLILSGRPFLGTSSISKEADFDCRVRFSRPENTANVVTAAVRQGVGAIAPMNDATLLRGLDLARAQCRLQVYPMIPNVIGYIRDATDYGMVGAGIRHLRRLSIGDLLGIGIRGLPNIRGALTRDFGTILSLLIDVEMAAFKKFRPPLVLLHSQVTDIAVAFGNQEALRVFADAIRRRFGAIPGVATNNFGALVQSLTRWKIDIPVIVAPFNPKGFLMKPTQQVCETLLKGTDKYVIADRIGTGGAEPPQGAFEYLHGLKIRSAVVDITEAAAVDSVIASHRDVSQGPSAGGRRAAAGAEDQVGMTHGLAGTGERG
jgi:hypothetical protein